MTCRRLEATERRFDDARAQDEARPGYAERVRFVQGDFLNRAERVPAGDAVVLDRVVCCCRRRNARVESSALPAPRGRHRESGSGPLKIVRAVGLFRRTVQAENS